MKLLLNRTVCGAVSTIGTLTIEGDDFTCYTCEDMDRKLEDGGVKVKGETCIPRGTYQVVISFSNRFRKPLPILLGVSGFEGIRIHPGNTAADTDGCILPGLEVSHDGTSVLQSRDAFNALFARINKALDAGEPVTIEVK